MGENIIYTAYFCSKRDPQRHKYWKANKIEMLNPLYNSVKRLGLSMVVFHDSLSKKFQKEYTTDKITFERYKPKDNIATERFHCFYKHLATHIYDKVLCLDCQDTEIYKDPFPLIDGSILIGSEMGMIADSAWIISEFQNAYGEVYHDNNRILNCGILGGKCDVLYKLLKYFYQDTQGRKENVDMAVFNKLIYGLFEYKTGYPIHTLFGENEGPESGCYIRHK